jgi:hypothetical protein
MLRAVKFAICVLALLGTCLAQDSLTIDNKGIVWLADLMPLQQRHNSKRAVTWADSTVEIERLAK